jgi:hypothetical protein
MSLAPLPALPAHSAASRAPAPRAPRVARGPAARPAITPRAPSPMMKTALLPVASSSSSSRRAGRRCRRASGPAASRLRGSLAGALRATEDDAARGPPEAAPEAAPDFTAPPDFSLPELSDDEEVKGAQMTAIVTGVVSVVLAVAYLGLVQLFDSREMLPPPPEAMGMGECPPGERRC